MNDIRVTIVTVCLNGARWIEDTIKSVLDQDYNNIEYIIVDGASTDESLIIIDKYKKSGIKLISEPDKGIYDAMNKGIEEASGELLGFLNVGDRYESGAMSALIELYKKTGADIIYGDAIQVYDDYDAYISYNALDFREYFRGNQIIHQSILAKTELYKSRKFNLKYELLADYDFFIHQYIAGKRFCYLPQNISYYRMGGVSTTSRFLVAYEKKEILSDVITNDNGLYDCYFERIKDDFLLDMFELHMKYIQGYTKYVKKILYKTICNYSKLVVFGIGNSTKEYCEYLSIDPDYYIDNDVKKIGNYYNEKSVVSPDYLIDESDIAILIFSRAYEDQMKKQLMNIVSIDKKQTIICVSDLARTAEELLYKMP